MKKAWIAFTAVFAILAVTFGATVISTGLAHTRLTFEVQNPVGDPSAAQNVEVSMVTNMNQQLNWDTTLTLGTASKVDTRFCYTAEQQPLNASYTDDQLNIPSSFGAWLSQDIITQWSTTRMGQSPYEAVILDVCSRAPATGTPYTETVSLNDYLDYYPITIQHNYSDPTCNYLPVDLSSVLSLPLPDHVSAEVTVTKEPDGSVHEYSLFVQDMPYTWAQPLRFDGAYYVAIPPAGMESALGEGGAQPGVYRLPLTTQEDGTTVIDVEKVTLVLPLDRGVESIHVVQEESKFLLVSPPTQEEAGQVTVVDADSWETLQQFPLKAAQQYDLHVEDDHLVYLTVQDNQTHLTAWTVDEAGMYAPTISAPVPGSTPERPSCSVSRVQDGRLYVICNTWSSSISSFDVGVFDSSGLLYYATYVPNQSRDTWATSYSLSFTEYPMDLAALPWSE